MSNPEQSAEVNSGPVPTPPQLDLPDAKPLDAKLSTESNAENSQGSLPTTTETATTAHAPIDHKAFFGTFRENIVFFGLIGAVIFAFGWFISYMTNLQLGVGPIVPSHEPGIGTGLGAIVLLIPSLWVGSFLHRWRVTRPTKDEQWTRQSKIRQSLRTVLYYLKMGLAGSVLTITLLYWFSNYTDGSLNIDTARDLAILGLIITGVVILMVNHVISVYCDGQGSDLSWLVPVGLLTFVMTMGIVSNNACYRIVGHNKAPFGGYLLQSVVYQTDLDKPGKRALLVTQNSDYIVFADYPNATAFWSAYDHRQKMPLRVTKIRADAVKAIQHAMESSPVPAPTPKATLPLAVATGSKPATPLPVHKK